MFLIVGLGNPDKQYLDTRHNIGYMLADNISKCYNFISNKNKFQSEFSEGRINNEKIYIQKPLTYMNLSGNAVIKAVSFYKIPTSNILVIHDDLDLDVGKVRVKIGGGSGGHNGLKNIDQHIGKDYMRLRIGIGHPENKNQVSDYVLSKFNTQDKSIIDQILDISAKNISLLLSGDSNRFTTEIAAALAL